MLSFFPGKFHAAAALGMGLVAATHPDDEFVAATAAFADALAAAMTALRTLKSNFVAAETLGFSDYVDLETARHLPAVNAAKDRSVAYLGGARD